jgi:putative nucleotidyltransferase with HDIG domain
LNCEALAKDGFSVDTEPSVAFTGGLLHDIGKLALNEVLNEECQTAIRSRIHEHGRSSVEAEQEVIGTDHAQVGACMLKAWKLPEEIIEAVGNHHHPASKPRARLSALVHTADCLTHLMGSTFGWEALAVRVDSDVTDAMKLTPEKMQGYMATAHGSLEQAKYLQNLS